MSGNQLKTFEDLGLVFSEGSGCITCRNQSCQGTGCCKKDNQEYNIHISKNEANTIFKIHACIETTVEANNNIDEEFTNEKDALFYLQGTFDGFKCI